MAVSKKIEKWTLVSIEWEDAFTHGEATSSDNFIEEHEKEPCIRHTSGYFLAQTSQRIYITETREEFDKSVEAGKVDDCHGITVIPLGMIRDIILMPPKKARKPRRKRSG